MANEKNLQDETTPTDLETRSLRPPDSITPALDPKAFNYTVMPISLASTAFTDFECEIQGEKIYYMEGQSRLRIKLDTNRNDYIDLYPGRKIIAPFKRFFITAPMADEIVKLCISSPYWVSVHGEGVEVNLAIRSKEAFRETELQRSFQGWIFEVGSALNYSHIQLWNPANSQILAVLETIIGTYAQNNSIGSFGCNIIALADSDGEECNKYCGKAAPTCEIRSESVDARIVPACILAHTGISTLNTENLFASGQHIILSPGHGFLISPISVDIDLVGGFQWIELPAGDISSF